MTLVSRLPGTFGIFIATATISVIMVPALSLATMHLGYGGTLLVLASVPVATVVCRGIPGLWMRLSVLRTQARIWHVPLVLLFLSGLVFRVRGIEGIQDNLLDFWTLYRVTLVCSAALVIVLWAVQRQDKRIPGSRQGFVGWLLGFCIFALVSSWWSVYPAWTLYKSLELFVDFLLVACIVSAARQPEDLRGLLNWIWALLALAVVTVWAGMPLWPGAIETGVGVLGLQLRGIYPAVAANGVGDLGAILGLVAMTRILSYPRSRDFYVPVLVISLLTLLLSYSRTPMVGFLIGAALLLYLCSPRILALSSLAAISLSPLLMLGPVADLAWAFWARGQSQEALMSLTGRTHRWGPTLDLVQENWFGLGAYAGTRIQLASVTRFEITSSVDNEWLEILSGTGPIGVALLLAALAWFLWEGRHQLRMGAGLARRLTVECLVVFAYIAFRSFFVTSFFTWHPPLVFMGLVGSMAFLRRQRLSEHRGEGP